MAAYTISGMGSCSIVHTSENNFTTSEIVLGKSLRPSLALR
jgi:hypothetical protein